MILLSQTYFVDSGTTFLSENCPNLIPTPIPNLIPKTRGE